MKKSLAAIAFLAFVAILLGTALSTEAAFCNTTGFPVCETFDGTPCGPLNPPSQRCIAPGVCEWGGCYCYSGTYHCVW